MPEVTTASVCDLLTKSFVGQKIKMVFKNDMNGTVASFYIEGLRKAGLLYSFGGNFEECSMTIAKTPVCTNVKIPSISRQVAPGLKEIKLLEEDLPLPTLTLKEEPEDWLFTCEGGNEVLNTYFVAFAEEVDQFSLTGHGITSAENKVSLRFRGTKVAAMWFAKDIVAQHLHLDLEVQ